MRCKGICIRHRAQKIFRIGRYDSGQKRCQVCEQYIRWDGLWCPCCSYRLRTTPRNQRYKRIFREREKKHLPEEQHQG